MDNAPLVGYAEGDEPSDQMTYKDAVNLLASGQGVRRTAVYGTSTAIESGRADLPPFLARGITPTRDFFAMFEVPFLYGGPWDAAAERDARDDIVISRELSEKMFGQANPVGKSRTFRVHRMAHRRCHRYLEADAALLPADQRQRRQLRRKRGVLHPLPDRHPARNGQQRQQQLQRRRPHGAGLVRLAEIRVRLHPVLVRGRSAADQARLEEFLGAYITDQKKLGRFPRPINVRVQNVMEWMEHLGVVSADAKLSTWLAFGFLLVCVVNTVGLLLAKFSARAGEIGVRRALGATRPEIFRQFLIEASVVGLVGGGLGLLLSFAGLWLISMQSEEMALVAKMDWAMLAATLSLAIGASILAGLLPTWRACQVTPALQLKTQ